MKITVRKLVSLNPERHEDWEIEIAISIYEDYLQSFIRSLKESWDTGKLPNQVYPKTFKRWLDTEI